MSVLADISPTTKKHRIDLKKHWSSSYVLLSNTFIPGNDRWNRISTVCIYNRTPSVVIQHKMFLSLKISQNVWVDNQTSKSSYRIQKIILLSKFYREIRCITIIINRSSCIFFYPKTRNISAAPRMLLYERIGTEAKFKIAWVTSLPALSLPSLKSWRWCTLRKDAQL